MPNKRDRRILSDLLSFFEKYLNNKTLTAKVGVKYIINATRLPGLNKSLSAWVSLSIKNRAKQASNTLKARVV